MGVHDVNLYHLDDNNQGRTLKHSNTVANAKNLHDKKAQEDLCRLLAKIQKDRRSSMAFPNSGRGGLLDTESVVEAELFRLAQTCAAQERIRSCPSKDSMRAIRKFGAALQGGPTVPGSGCPRIFACSSGSIR